MALVQQRYPDEACDEHEEGGGLASIRAARHRVEQETQDRLEEQARWRMEAQLRDVPWEQLRPSREADLQRLEAEARQAERGAIDIIEQRMELALRAIEADNARILEEERAKGMAAQRLDLASQAMRRARERQEEESRLADQLRQRLHAEEEAQHALAERSLAEQALHQLATDKKAQEQRLKLTLEESFNEMQWAVRYLEQQDALSEVKHHRRLLWVTLVLTWVLSGMLWWWHG